MEGFRQALGAIYVALAEAAGGDELDRANDILNDALKSGAVHDDYARCALMALVRASSPDISTISIKEIEHV